MRLPLPDMRARLGASTGQAASWQASARAALWQAPLIGLLAIDIGAVLLLFWGAGLVIGRASHRWQRWYVQLPLLIALIGVTAMVVPVRSADFFITLLVALLPLTWQLEDKAASQDHQPTQPGAALSPAGLTPTIFLVGSVFLYQIQFFVLLLVVIWLLAFLLWYCMALTGFRLDSLTLRWVPVLFLSAAVAAIIVALFIAVPRISTGVIPGFAQQQKIALTDEIAPGGMRDLLEDDTIAFRAVPQQQADPVPRYWRVFVLDAERDGVWNRGGMDQPTRQSTFASMPVQHGYALLLDDHDPKVLPAPDWPAGFSRDYGFNRRGEVITSRMANPRRVVVEGAALPPETSRPAATALVPSGNPRLADWARQTRAAVNSDAEFAELIMQRFASEYRYDTTLNLPQDNALDRFFFETRQGYCAYFATAMVTALRAAGIESHIVMGYLGGEWNAYGGYWTVRNADAHAWVEARLDGGAWQRLDPTLQVMTGNGPQSVANAGPVNVTRPEIDTGADAQSGPLMARLRQAGQWVDALNTRITIAIMDYGQSDTGGTGDDGQDNTAFIFAGIGLAMVGVIGAAALAALSRRGRRQHRLERRFERLLEPVGDSVPRLSGETLIAYGQRQTAAMPPPLSEMAMALARSITELRYSPHSDLQPQQIAGEMAMFRRELGQQGLRQPWWQVIWRKG